MKLHLKQLLPTSYELIGGGFLTIVIILLANSKQLLSYYGLQSSDQIIKSSAGQTLNSALRTIDSLSATDGIVTFLIWALVGVVCFGIVEGIARALSELKFENELSSGRYIHPATFTKVKFWRGVLLDTIALAFGVAVLLVGVFAFVLFFLPISLAYSRVFLFNVSLQNTLYMLLGFVVAFAGWLVLTVAVRFLLHRHRILSLS